MRRSDASRKRISGPDGRFSGIRVGRASRSAASGAGRACFRAGSGFLVTGDDDAARTFAHGALDRVTVAAEVQRLLLRQRLERFCNRLGDGVIRRTMLLRFLPLQPFREHVFGKLVAHRLPLCIELADLPLGKIRFVDRHVDVPVKWQRDWTRSEETTSELKSLMRISSAVFCLKKKITNKN